RVIGAIQRRRDVAVSELPPRRRRPGVGAPVLAAPELIANRGAHGRGKIDLDPYRNEQLFPAESDDGGIVLEIVERVNQTFLILAERPRGDADADSVLARIVAVGSPAQVELAQNQRPLSRSRNQKESVRPAGDRLSLDFHRRRK